MLVRRRQHRDDERRVPPRRGVEHRHQDADAAARAGRRRRPSPLQGRDGVSRSFRLGRVLPRPLEREGVGMRREAVDDEEHVPGAVAFL